MKVTVAVDNIGSEETLGEWGLSLFIEYNGRNILLDAGTTPLFADNMKKLGLDIGSVDTAVLSHAHCDHAGGMPCFFENNRTAKLYMRECCDENCFMKIGLYRRYRGIPEGMLRKYSGRIITVSENTEIMDGVYIICHKKAVKPAGKAQHLFVKRNGKYQPDDFSHEQSLVFRTEKGLVILNSCSHTGADSIIREVKEVFPDEKIYAIMGGFHLVAMPKSYIKRIAEGIKESGIEKVYTGHCTKERGFRILKDELGDMAEQFHVGMQIEF